MTRLRLWLVVALLLTAAVSTIVHQQQRLQLARSHLQQQQHLTAQAEQVAATQHSVISELLQALHTEQQAQQQLQQQHQRIRQALRQREHRIEELIHENQELREWAAVPLPATARQLRQRPAISGAADYQAWLSGSGALQPPGNPAEPQRRPAD